MPDHQRHAQRPARVAGSRLHPDVFEDSFLNNLSVAAAVQRDAAREAEFFHARLAPHVPGHAQHDLFGDLLNRRRDVHVALGQFRFRLARRRAEKCVELLRGHGQALAIIEIGHVHAKRAVVFQIDQVLQNVIDVRRLPIGREAHELVFARVDAEAAIISERRIQQAERVREIEFVRQADFIPAPDSITRRRPFAHAIERQHGGLFEG